MKTLSVVLKSLSTIIIAFILILMFLLVGIRIFGLQPYTVLSGSMQSVYPTGSVIYVKNIDPSELEIDDIITFEMSGGSIATHRIIEIVNIDNENMAFRTKGDENDIADGSLVSFDDVIGKPIFCIRGLGFLANYIQHPPGSIIAVTVAIALIIFEIIIEIILDNSKKKTTERGHK